jgi:uncharacterized protein involved in high-affinity Fe2+ transport|tara:strand:+ start:384 stop:731 length:348 start_codon:yes stop_codon:yes gene_type:complete
MRIDEFTKPVKDTTPYDVPSDVHFHMLNDDSFYRQHYLPCMEKIRSERNEDIMQGHLMPMIDKCLNHYCIKYDIPKNPNELMTAGEKSELASKVMDFERNPKEKLDAPTPVDRIT